MHEELLANIIQPSYKNKKVLSFLQSIKSITDCELWGNLHKEWAEATNITGNSMYGSTYEVFWKHVKEGGELAYDLSCTDCTYTGKQYW